MLHWGMRKNVGWVSFCFLVLLAAGCASRPEIDWASRVGHYTYDDAVREFGPPDKTAELSDGSRVAEWISVRRGGVSFGLGTGISTGNVGVGVGQTVRPGSGHRVLKLTFDPQGVLFSHLGKAP
jgi:hypothetical protein